jgi:3-oxoacyl-[acyl-carrier protein] reductase
MISIDLSDQVALVTGASRGLGAATASSLHRAGAAVAINYFPDAEGRCRADALALADELGERAWCVPADVTDAAAVDAMVAQIVERFGRLDLVINNAGILRDRTLKKMSRDEWQAVIDTNLTGVFNVCKAAASVLEDGGRIVNLASIAATVGFFGQSNYAAAKAGVMALTRVLSRELASRQITVNSVAPGVVLTDMGQSIPENVREQMIAQVPLGRFGEPADIAHTIAFLCSDLASYLTGQTIHVNGGWVG